MASESASRLASVPSSTSSSSAPCRSTSFSAGGDRRGQSDRVRQIGRRGAAVARHGPHRQRTFDIDVRRLWRLGRRKRRGRDGRGDNHRRRGRLLLLGRRRCGLRGSGVAALRRLGRRRRSGVSDLGRRGQRTRIEGADSRRLGRQRGRLAVDGRRAKRAGRSAAAALPTPGPKCRRRRGRQAWPRPGEESLAPAGRRSAAAATLSARGRRGLGRFGLGRFRLGHHGHGERDPRRGCPRGWVVVRRRTDGRRKVSAGDADRPTALARNGRSDARAASGHRGGDRELGALDVLCRRRGVAWSSGEAVVRDVSSWALDTTISLAVPRECRSWPATSR